MYNINRKILKIRYELGKATFIPNMCNLFPLWFAIQVWYQNSFCRQKHYIFHRSLMYLFFTFACIIYSICTYNTMFANWVITWWKMFSGPPNNNSSIVFIDHALVNSSHVFIVVNDLVWFSNFIPTFMLNLSKHLAMYCRYNIYITLILPMYCKKVTWLDKYRFTTHEFNWKLTS